MAVRILTNHHRRELLSWDELPEQERERFDYVTGEDRWSPRFVHYRGSWVDVSDMDGSAWSIGVPEEFRDWAAYASDSFFSGVLVKFPDLPDCDTVVIGRYYVSDSPEGSE
jgi:hypothetical protein